MPDPAYSNLQSVVGNRDASPTAADRAAARELERALPPEQQTEHTFRALERQVVQNKYNADIERAVEQTHLRAPAADIDPVIVKSLLYQESSMVADAGHAGGTFRGIAQISPGLAREQGLTVNADRDDRLDPSKAIPAVPKILADFDYVTPYNHYVKEGFGPVPTGDERAKFYLAGYNGGPGTIAAAMKYAEADGRNPLKFENLLAAPGQPIESSPLYRAVDTVLRKDAPSIDPHEKYDEISHYANDIVARAEAMRASAGHAAGVPPVQPIAAQPAHNGAASVPAPPHVAAAPEVAVQPGWHISGELKNGGVVESKSLLDAKNRLLTSAIDDAKNGQLPAFAYAASQGESARTIAMQNELLDRAVAMHLPANERAAYLASKKLDLGPAITADAAAPGATPENAASLDAKNAKVQTAIVLARNGMIDRHDFPPEPGVSAATLEKQNQLLHAAIASNLPADQRAAYEASLGAAATKPSPQVAETTAHAPVTGHANGPTPAPGAAPAPHVATVPPIHHGAPDIAGHTHVTPGAAPGPAPNLDGWSKAPSPPGTEKLLAPSMQAFEKAYAAQPGHPHLNATFDQHTSTLTLAFSDAEKNRYVSTVRVGESSVRAFSAHDIVAGHYSIGRPIESTQLPRRQADVPYGLAYTQIYNADHSDGIPAKDGTTHTGVGMHGGGSRLAQPGNLEPAFAKNQPLVPTEGCVRLHNEDALSLAHLVEKAGPIELDIRGRSSRAVTVAESVAALHAEKGVALPAVANVEAWDGKPHTGTMVKIDDTTYAQHVGQGKYQTYDVNHDLHGHEPPNGRRIDIDPQGRFEAPQHAPQQHAIPGAR